MVRRADGKCSKCGETHDGKHAYCSKCNYEIVKAWKTANPERIKAERDRTNRRYRELRESIIFHYGGKCECCGEDRPEFLSIDHIDGGGTAHKRELGKRSGAYLRWIRDSGFPDNLRVLCHNCNQALGAYGYCPHQKEQI